MTYKILKEKRKSETSPPRNSERSREPIAEDEDVVEDERQVQKETFKNIPAPSSLYNSEKSKEPTADLEDEKKDKFKNCTATFPLYNEPIEGIEDEKQTPVNRNNPVSALSVPCHDKELEELIRDLKCLRQKEDDVIRTFEESGSLPCQPDYSNNKMGFQERAMQNRESVANRKRLLKELRELSAWFRQKQDEAFREFKSKSSGSLHHLDCNNQPMQNRETETDRELVAPVAFKEERSSCEEKETLNVPVPTENQLKCMDGSMEEEVVITTEGGLIEIQDTGVSLEIPPGALVKEQLIKMRIVSEDYHDDLAVSFGSNASVVVELLPSNLALLKPAKLTLPHCLVLKRGCEWKAKIYTSHHEKGNQPLWEEDLLASCELHESFCFIWLQCFCWMKFFAGAKIVKALKIWLFAARRTGCTRFTSDAYVDVGFYLDLPHGQEAANITAEDILHKQKTSFYIKGGLPLKILFDKEAPSIWTSATLPNPKEIAFQRVTTSSSCHSTFVLKEQTNLEITDVTCNFKAGQGTDLIDLIFPLQIWRPPIFKFASGEKTANIKQPPAAEETMETSSSAETAMIPSNLCSTHRSISRGELTSGPPLDFPATLTCYKCEAVFKYVALRIAAKWWDVGRNLKITGHTINIIKADYPNDCKEQSYRMLEKWINKFGSGAKFMVLGKALEDDGNLLLKQQLEQKLKE